MISSHGSHTIKTLSSAQSTISLSSPDGEYYGITKGISLGLGVVSMARDMDIDAHTDTDISIDMHKKEAYQELGHSLPQLRIETYSSVQPIIFLPCQPVLRSNQCFGVVPCSAAACVFVVRCRLDGVLPMLKVIDTTRS